MTKDTTKYVIDPDNFEGVVVTSMRDGVHNDYHKGETLEDIRARDNNPNLIAVSWEDLVPHVKKYHDSLQGEFEEITEEEYYNLLNCLPPARWKGTRFFLCEGYTGSLHKMCFKLGDKCYAALRSIKLTDEAINAQINEFDKRING